MHHRIASPTLRRALIAALALAASTASTFAIPAFPGAEGFGANSLGGRGGSVYVVTNLNDSGAGSFRDAVSQPNRTVVFAVGGIINLTSGRVAVKNNITIAGQTAPGQGITIYGNGVSFSNASNTITRYIRFRQGINGDSGTDAVGIASGDSMIFDHVSASWGRDETFSVSGSPSNITLQDCVVSQGLLVHSAGGLMQTDGGVSVFRSFYADNWMRNPKVKGIHEFTNNVVFNWGSGGGYILGDSAGLSYTNIVGNYFIAGPNTGTTPSFIRGNLNFNVYADGNLEDFDRDGVLDGLPVHPLDQSPVVPVATRYNYPAVATLLSAQDAYNHVVAYAGASLYRDAADQYVFNELASHGTAGAHIYNESEMGGVGTLEGGLAPKDTDNDGMPDWWESAAGTDPLVADNNGDLDGDGYTNIENYINALAYSGIPGARIEGIVTDTGVSGTDAITSDTTISLHGTSAPNRTILISRVDTGLLGSTVADASGNWTYDYTGTVLTDRHYAFTATADLGDGKYSPPSRALAVQIDTTPADAPVITSLVSNPSLAFNGTAEPLSSIVVTLAGIGDVGTATTDGFGNWTAAYTGAPLAPGIYSFTATATDLAGNTGSASADYVVDTGLSSPVFTSITSDSGISNSDQITNDATLTINGTAPAGSTVSITRGGVGVVGSATADGAGAWVFNYTSTTLPNGQHTFTATASTGSISSPASAPFLVTVDTARPTIPSLVRYNPSSPATASSTLVFRVTMSEPVVNTNPAVPALNVDIADFSLTKTPASITGAISSVTQISPTVFDVTVTGVSGDGTIRLDRPSSATITDLAGNTTNSGFTGGQSYTLRLPGSGVWANTEGGAWSDTANWESNVIATGAGATADFATRDIDGAVPVTLDTPRTLGRLVFADADPSSPGQWTVTNNGNVANGITLSTSGTPTIDVAYTEANASNPTLATNGQLIPATIDAPLTSPTLTKTGWGTVILTQPATIGTTLAVSQGVLKVGPGGSMTNTTVAVGNSSQLHVSGGTYNATGTTTITNGGFSGVYVSGGTANFATITNTGDRDGLVKNTGGTLNISTFLIPRSASADITLTNVDSVFQYGFLAQGGVTNIGTFTLASNNSWAFSTIDAGEVNITGPATLANQVTSNRGARMRIKGGRLNVTEPNDGLVLAKKNGSNANNIASLYLFGGTATLSKLTLGFDATVTGGYGLVSLEGGSLYLGSGGLVKKGTFNTFINLYSGRLGATDSWSSSVPMALVATGNAAIHAANEAGDARDITLSGVLSDWSGTMPAANLQNPGQVASGGPGGFRKTGAGTLTLSAASTFTGDVAVEEGTLAVTGSLAAGGSVSVGGVLSGTGTIDKAVVLNAGGTIAPGIGGAGTLPAASLTWNGGGTLAADLGAVSDQLALTGALTKGSAGAYTVAFAPSAPLAIGANYTLATFGSTDFAAADFSATGLGIAKGTFTVNAGSLVFTVTSDGSGQLAYDAWASGYVFPAGLEGPAADADGDGASNLLEFILGQDPLSAGVENVKLITVADGGADYPALRFTRVIARGDVGIEVRATTNLDFSTTLGAVEISAIDQGNGTELVTVRSAVSYAIQPKQFLRLEATLP